MEKRRPLFPSAWKSRKPGGIPTFPQPRRRPVPYPRVAAQIQNQAPSVNLWLDQKRRAGQVGIVGASVVLGLLSILLAPRDSFPRVTPHSETTR